MPSYLRLNVLATLMLVILSDNSYAFEQTLVTRHLLKNINVASSTHQDQRRAQTCVDFGYTGDWECPLCAGGYCCIYYLENLTLKCPICDGEQCFEIECKKDNADNIYCNKECVNTGGKELCLDYTCTESCVCNFATLSGGQCGDCTIDGKSKAVSYGDCDSPPSSSPSTTSSLPPSAIMSHPPTLSTSEVPTSFPSVGLSEEPSLPFVSPSASAAQRPFLSVFGSVAFSFLVALLLRISIA